MIAAPVHSLSEASRARTFARITLPMSRQPILTGLLNIVQTYYTNWIGNRVLRDLRDRLFGHLERMSLAFFTATRTGEVQSRLANDVGGLYETEGRAWVVRPKPEDVAKWLKPGDWNALAVIALGNRVVVQLNGHQTAEVRDDPDA